jgi:hypothetical protein
LISPSKQAYFAIKLILITNNTKMNIRKLLFVGLAIILCANISQAQITQVVKGNVRDKDSQIPLPGATILIETTNPSIGTTSDMEGNFKLEKVPIGRQTVRISFIGYEPCIIRELLVSSGKEIVLNIELKESSIKLETVTIKAYSNKEQPLNTMASVSARQLNVEEANRYAGGFDDPARLATSFAGVSGNLANNGIVIRGNSPKGLLWRIEGVEISTPSHFANITTFGGGGITALSSQMLANSDFYTGAFPAEYGNVLSGVFDIRLRNGNNEKSEFTIQAGLIGIDFSAEGPFSKNAKASYLFNYRYSTFGLIEPLLPSDAGGIRYQDLSFKLNFPTQKAGTFSVWGIGATDKSPAKAEEDSAKWIYTQDMSEEKNDLHMGGLGFNHRITLNNKAYLHSSVAVSGNGLMHKKYEYLKDMILYPTEAVDYYNWKYTASAFVNQKFSSKHTNKTGIEINDMHYNVDFRNAYPGNPLVTTTKYKASSQLYKVYTQSRFDLNPRVTITAGLYGHYFDLNNRYSVEPRASLAFKLAPKHKITFGYGLHSQLELIQIYLIRAVDRDGFSYPNRNLDFAKAHHFVLGYDWSINDNLRLKVEPYFQHLYHVPVKKNSSFSMLNLDKDWFITDTLENSGTGTNMGIDLTFEHFLQKGYYYLFTASFLNSKYTGGDKIEHSSRFNRGYVFNVLGGKEWSFKNNKILSINGRVNFMGGERISPLNYSASVSAKEAVYDDTRAFENSKPNVWYADLTIIYKINRAKHSSSWSLKFINVFGTKEFNGYRFNHKTGSMEKEEEAIMIPNLSYKIDF